MNAAFAHYAFQVFWFCRMAYIVYDVALDDTVYTIHIHTLGHTSLLLIIYMSLCCANCIHAV